MTNETNGLITDTDDLESEPHVHQSLLEKGNTMNFITVLGILLKRKGYKAKIADLIILYLKEARRLKLVGWGVDKLDEFQHKVLLDRSSLQWLSKWMQEHPNG